MHLHFFLHSLSLAVLLALSAAADREPSSSPVGPIHLLDADGDEMVLDNYEERPATVLLFLSSRCQATEQSIAEINKLYEKYRLREVLYVGVCANDVETAAELEMFANQRGIIYSIYRDPSGDVACRLNVNTTPGVCLLDQSGRLVYQGELDTVAGRETLETAIGKILGGMSVQVDTVSARGTPIDKPGKPIQRTNPYGAPYFSSELIFQQIPDAVAHHCSTLTQAPNGDLLCLWYGGSYESADDQVLFLSRRTAGEREWTRPVAMLKNRRMPPGNAVIFVDGRRRVQIIWGRMESTRPLRRGGGWDRCRLMARISTDNAKSWTKDRVLLASDELAINDTLWCVPRNPPIRLTSGKMVLPLGGAGGSVFVWSGDGGETWQRGGSAVGGSQPALAQHSNGSLLALLRSSPRTAMVTSVDEGLTWSPATATDLKNPGAGISLARLANGHLVFVFNDSETDRTPLSIVRSTDEGRSWEDPLALEANPGEYSYPCVIQSADGRIHVTYTFRRYSIKHVELNEDWLTHMSRPN
jgi:BNR repeat protein/AhpC/TSA family protein